MSALKLERLGTWCAHVPVLQISSDEVGTSAARSGSPENMVVAVLFATLAHMHIKFQVVPVSWPTSPLSRVEHPRTKLAPVPLGRAAPKTWS